MSATVLLVEDDRLCQRLAEKVFRGAGHVVLTANTARGGIEMLLSHILVDLVVLDSQLDGDWGWTFLADARARPYFKDLPVVVYSGQTEREDVLRYVELGVQAFHVKPFKAEVLLNELQRTIASGRMERLIQAPEAVCARLNIGLQEYGGLLNAAVTHLEEDRRIARERLKTSSDPLLTAALSRMRTRLTELGVTLVENLVVIAEEALLRSNLGAAADALGMLDVLGDRLRQRALTLLEMGNSVPRTDGATGASRMGSTLAKPVVNTEANSSVLGTDARRMVGRPLWSFGPFLGRLNGKAYIGEEELLAGARAQVASPPISVLLDAIKLIESVPDLTAKQVVRILASVTGFKPACTRILMRVGVLNRAETDYVDWDLTVTTLGTAKATVLAAVGRVARAEFDNPIELDGLRHQALTLALLAFDLGKLLKLAFGHRLAAAALARDIGRWVLAATEPGLMALALAQVSAGVPLETAERSMFGMENREVGRKFLASISQPDLLVEIAGRRSMDEQGLNPENQITVAIVLLAESLIRAVFLEGDRKTTRIREELVVPNHPTWALLRSQGVDIPLDIHEFVDVVLTLTRSAHWIAREATQ